MAAGAAAAAVVPPNDNAVVMDFGAFSCRVGYSGDDKPARVFRTAVGRRLGSERLRKHHPRSGAECHPDGAVPNPDVSVGDAAYRRRHELAIVYPLCGGYIESWCDIEHMMRYAFESINCDPKTHQLLITEPPLEQTANREKSIQIAFETFGVTAYYASNCGVLSLYAAGRTTGLTVDIGHHSTKLVPIYEGYALPHLIQRLYGTGAQYAAEYLGHLTDWRSERRRSDKLTTDEWREAELLQEMMHETAYAAIEPTAQPAATASTTGTDAKSAPAVGASAGSEKAIDVAIAAASDGSSVAPPLAVAGDVKHTTRDGCAFTVSDAVRRACSDAILHPYRLSQSIIPPLLLESEALPIKELTHLCSDYYFDWLYLPQHEQKASANSKMRTESLAQTICDTIAKCDIELWADMFKNIVLCGGGSMMHGMQHRLTTEIQAIIDSDERFKFTPAGTTASATATVSAGAGAKPAAKPRVTALQKPVTLKVIAPPERYIMSWLGGSILSSLTQCGQSMWISADEYNENGPNYVHRKCF